MCHSQTSRTKCRKHFTYNRPVLSHHRRLLHPCGLHLNVGQDLMSGEDVLKEVVELLPDEAHESRITNFLQAILLASCLGEEFSNCGIHTRQLGHAQLVLNVANA